MPHTTTELQAGGAAQVAGAAQAAPVSQSGSAAPHTSVAAPQAAAAAPDWAAGALGERLLDPDGIAARVGELAAQITADYRGRPPLLVGVLKGAFVFMSDLVRAIRLPITVDFMAVASYGSATKSSGVVRIVKDLDVDLTDRHVLVVEDIVDSGLTLSYLRRSLLARHPASLEVCALLVKEGRQRGDLDLKYTGFTIPPCFVVGYGLDLDERFRNLPGVWVHDAATAMDRAAEEAAGRGQRSGAVLGGPAFPGVTRPRP